MRGVEHDHTRGSLRRSIVLLAVPMVLEMAMESLFAVADVIFVSQLGKAAVATVGLTEAVMTIVYAIGIGLAMATTALVARRIGEKDTEGAQRAAAQAVIAGLIAAVVLGVPGALFGDVILGLMQEDGDVLETGAGYARILLGANGVILMLFLHNAIFRGAGDAAVAMRSLWIANGLNLVLDPLLIFGFGPIPAMGIEGAAIATTAGRSVGVLYQTWCLRRGVGRIQLRGAAMRLDLPVLRNLISISMGGIVQMLIATSSWIVIMRIVALFGTSASAGTTIAVRIVMFFLLPAWGLSNAAATLVGQNLGAENPDRAARAVWATGQLNSLFLGAITLLFLLAADTMVAPLSEGDPEVRRIAARALRIFASGYIFYAWGMVLVQAFNGAGDTRTPTYINLACFWVLESPLAWTLAKPLGLGPEGAYWSVAISEAMLAVVAFVLFRRGRWKSTAV
ncbi:MAG: MATE family efflux transporter [Planctomycetota bacterium]